MYDFSYFCGRCCYSIFSKTAEVYRLSVVLQFTQGYSSERACECAWRSPPTRRHTTCGRQKWGPSFSPTPQTDWRYLQLVEIFNSFSVFLLAVYNKKQMMCHMVLSDTRLDQVRFYHHLHLLCRQHVQTRIWLESGHKLITWSPKSWHWWNKMVAGQNGEAEYRQL